MFRANYDSGGKENVDGTPKVDPATLYAMIFGSEKFIPIVGELKLASQMQMEEDDASISHPKLRAFRQRKREIQCALNLVVKLQPYIDFNGDAEHFDNTVIEEVQELSASPFGSTLVAVIGKAYYEHALSELSTFDSIQVGIKQATRKVSTGLSIASEGMRAAFVANEVSKAQKNKEAKDKKDGIEHEATGSTEKPEVPIVDDEEIRKKIEKLSGHMFAVM